MNRRVATRVFVYCLCSNSHFLVAQTITSSQEAQSTQATSSQLIGVYVWDPLEVTIASEIMIQRLSTGRLPLENSLLQALCEDAQAYCLALAISLLDHTST